MSSEKQILLCALCMAIATFGFEIPNLQGHYQDLTFAIDKIIFENENTNFTQNVLQDALNRSTKVYYSTDMRMNNITDLIPVIDLLNKLKPPETSPISILLSLRFTNNNRFTRWDRDDVFYDLTLNITKDTWEKILLSIDYVVVDMTTESCTNSNFFYSNPDQPSLETPIRQYSYPEYIKNFLSFYKQLTKQTTQKTIPVGLAYNSTQIGCSNYLPSQVKDADFLMITQHFSPYKGFPFTAETLYDTAFQIQNKSNAVYFNRRSFRFCASPQIFYILQMNSLPTHSQISNSWNSDMRNLLMSTPQLIQLLENMIENLYKINLELLLARRSDSLSQYGSICSYVLGNSITAELSNLYVENTQHFKPAPATIIPTVTATEYKYNYCTAREGLSRVKNGSFLVDEETWRAMARMEAEFSGSGYCNIGYSYYRPTIAGNQVILVFRHGIRSEWSATERNMNLLVGKHGTIGNATLNTIVFHEDDISAPKNEIGYSTGHEHISNFLRKWDGIISTGCVVGLDAERIKDLGRKSGRFRDAMMTLCEPVFDIVDLFIWQVPNDLSVENGYSGKHDAVLVARELFLAEFPEKKVFLQLDYEMKYEVAAEWANLYGVQLNY